MVRVRNSTVRDYLLAVVSTSAAVFFRWTLHPVLETRLLFVTVFLNVLACARFLGVGPSILAAVAGSLGVSAAIDHWDPISIVINLIVSGVAITIIELLGRANRKAQESARLAEERLRQLREETEQRAREASLSAQARAVVESSADAIVSRGLDGSIHSWNHGAEQIFGYTAAEAIGRPISILIPPDHAGEEEDIVAQIRSGSRLAHFETVRLRKDGKQIHVSLTISPILGGKGEIVGISDIARDITERRAFEEQLRQTQKLESLGVLAGGLAHDFNNLLTGIMGNASLAIHDLGESNPISERMTEILQASERAALLVGQMLAYAGKGRYVVERLDLSAQVREIVTLVRGSVSRLVNVDLQLAADLPAVEADRSQIQQIIMNLVVNGAESLGDHAGTVTISTSARQANGERQVVLEVRDTGCGMDTATKARIFDPFFTTKFTGRGLGLAAVLGIIQSHSGSIQVDSTPGEGSTFTVVLPAAAESAKVAPAESPMDMRGFGHILVADDEELIRSMARFTLQRYGYTVELAKDGREAVDALAGRPDAFSAVLLDLTMPIMSGEEALRRMRAIRADIPVIISSGYSEMEAARQFHDQESAGFLQKPYTATALARKIKQAILLGRCSTDGAS